MGPLVPLGQDHVMCSHALCPVSSTLTSTHQGAHCKPGEGIVNDKAVKRHTV